MPAIVGWIALFLAGIVVLAPASRFLVRAADQLALLTRMSHLFIGTLLVATATSLPELVTAGAAVLRDAPELAIGDLLGSSMANMAILAIVDLMHRRTVLSRAATDHARSVAVAIGLTSVVALAIAGPDTPNIFGIGIEALVIGGVYVLAIAWLRRGAGLSPVLPVPTGIGQEAPRLRSQRRAAIVRFIGASLAILLAGPALAISSERIADLTDLGRTFVGVTLLAIATSLPELSASIAAVRIGSTDLAVGNLVGSNSLNIALIPLLDLFYRPGPILGAVGQPALVAAIVAIGLMAIALAIIVHGAETRIHRLEPDALLLLIVYFAAVVGLFSVR